MPVPAPARLGAARSVRLHTDPARLPDAPLTGSGPFARTCRALDLHTFRAAARWLQTLPYGRSSAGRDPKWVPIEGRRTCSSGSGFLVGLAQELGLDLSLVWLVYRLDAQTDPAAGPALQAHGVDSVLEVHTVVGRSDMLFDPIRQAPQDLAVLAQAHPSPEDLGEPKVDWHRRLMEAAGESDRWSAREAAIAALGEGTAAGIHSVDPESVLALRQLVLRPHMTPQASVYAEDGDGGTHHLAYRDGSGQTMAVGTSLVQNRQGGPDGGRRLRGMAVDPACRGTGLGRRILDGLVAWAAFEGASEVWCNARESAMGFYARAGWLPASERFDLPGIGPHFVMQRDLS